MIAQTLLIAAGIYLLCGLAFAIPFVFVGVRKIDPHAAHGSWGFRALIIPGTMFLWPLLARRWLSGAGAPPEEKNAHRSAARRSADFQSVVSQACSLPNVENASALENPCAQPTASRRYGRLQVCATGEKAP
jgi:hypothetical protein